MVNEGGEKELMAVSEVNLKDEEFKGENYLDIPFKSKHENIYEKRIEQIAKSQNKFKYL